MRGQGTSYWTNAGSGVWNWNAASSWDPGLPTSTTTRVYWTNNAAAAYTVKLDGPATSGLVRVTSDKVTFDLNGYRWDAPDSGSAADYNGGNAAVSHWFGGAAGEVCDLVFSSSRAGENIIKLNSGLQRGSRWGNGTADSLIQITTNLGHGVVVIVPPNGGPYGARLIVRGPGAEFRNPAANYFAISKGNVRIVDGGLFNVVGWCYAGSLTGNTTVDNATLRFYTRPAGYTYIGNVHHGQVVVTNKGSWIAGNTVQTGYNSGRGSLIVDDAVFIGQAFRIGDPKYHGEVVVRNGGRMILTNGWISIIAGATTALTNTLRLDDGMIEFAGAAGGSAITNAALIRGNGTILCSGDTPAVVRNQGRMVFKDGGGRLALTNTCLENTASGTLAFAFGEGGGDAVHIQEGTATIGGTSHFATVSFTPERGADRRWVFVEADQIDYTAQDNMDTLMTSFGLTAGSDYFFGVREGAGRQQLLLWVKPPHGSLLLVR
jgi:hypothetical protein